MRLYHGTTEAVARKALTEGLLPRMLSGSEGNWKDNPSESSLVYMTSAYAPYFGFCASEVGDKIGIVEIDTDLLNVSDLRPDEDFLEQASRGSDGFLPDFLQEELDECTSMQSRTAWFKQHLMVFAPMWKDSVEMMGNCAHFGHIPPEAIVRVTVFDTSKNPLIYQTAMDPTISILNFQFMADKYHAITSWLMGKEVTVEEFYGQFGMLMLHDPAFAEQVAKADGYLRDRSSLEIIENKERKQNAA